MHKMAIAHPTTFANMDYLEYAIEKQSQVLAKFVPMLSNPTPGDTRTLFALAALVTIWSFASRCLPPQLNIVSRMPFENEHAIQGHASRQRKLGDLLSVMKISQGIGAVVNQCRPWFRDEGLASMIQRHHMSPQPQGQKGCHALDELLDSLQDDCGYLDQLEMYAAAIQRTKDYVRGFCAETRSHVAVGWPVGLPKAFMKAVSDHEPPALVITAFWSACVSITPYWWAQGWGTGVITEIESYLPQCWRRYLEWPIALLAQTQLKTGLNIDDDF